MLTLCCVVPTTTSIGGSNEPIQEAITRNLALSLSLGLGPEVSVSDTDGERRGGGGPVYSGLFRATACGGDGTERAGRSRAFVGNGAAESVNLELRGDAEGENGDPSIQQVPRAEAKAVLGKPLLGQGVLRRYGRARRGKDPQVRAVPGEQRETSRANSVGLQGIGEMWGQRLFASSGCKVSSSLSGG